MLALPQLLLVISLVSNTPASRSPNGAKREAVARANVGVPGYERWIRSPTLWPLERRLSRVIKGWGGRHDLRLLYDARLALVARSALGEVPKVANARLNLESLRARAYRLGWTDGELAAVTVRTSLSSDIDSIVATELTARLGTVTPNYFGVAAKTEGTERIVMVLVSQRLVRLWPLPAVVARGERVNIAGSVITDPNTVPPSVPTIAPPIDADGNTNTNTASSKTSPAVTLAVGSPDGKIQRRPVTLKGMAFEVQIDTGSLSGTLDIQLLVDRGHGPEIAAQFPVGVGRRPDEAQPPASLTELDDANPIAADGLGPRLAALVLGSRAAAGVALPASSTALDEVATSHVADMRGGGYFAHVSPRYGDLTRRLARRGVVVTRALENLARARNVDDVLHQWLASPAHRANLLDPDVDAMGIGVATVSNGEVLAVLVLARRSDAGDSDELASRALARINAARLRQGLNALVWDADLARLAVGHSREAAQGYRDDDLAARVASELDTESAGINLFVGTGIDMVTRSDELLLPYERAGIGVVRMSSQDPRLWVTVIYAKD